MNRAGLGLILAALSCSEPTANYQRPATTAVHEPPEQHSSYSISPLDRTVYVRLAGVRTQDGESIHAFMRRLFESADSAGAVRLVIDLRSVTGSDARFLVPLIKGVAMRDRLVQAGGLYLVVGPDSFSPSQNAATLLLQYAKPTFLQGSLNR